MPDLDGCQTCELIIDVYKKNFEPNPEDTESEAAVRRLLFMPEMICCSAYDATNI